MERAEGGFSPDGLIPYDPALADEIHVSITATDGDAESNIPGRTAKDIERDRAPPNSIATASLVVAPGHNSAQ